MLPPSLVVSTLSHPPRVNLYSKKFAVRFLISRTSLSFSLENIASGIFVLQLLKLPATNTESSVEGVDNISKRTVYCAVEKRNIKTNGPTIVQRNNINLFIRSLNLKTFLLVDASCHLMALQVVVLYSQ